MSDTERPRYLRPDPPSKVSTLLKAHKAWLTDADQTAADLLTDWEHWDHRFGAAALFHVKHGQRTRAVMESQRLGMTHEERHELAEMLVGHEGSWTTLRERDAKRIADALEAFLIVQGLLLIRGVSPYQKANHTRSTR